MSKTKKTHVLPESIYPLFRKGLLALKQDAWSEAISYFEEVLLYAPEDSDTWVNLGAIALAQHQKQMAVHYFTQALLYDEDHLEARHNLAATFIHFDRFENALTHYTLLLKQYPEHLEYHYNAGVCEMNLGHLAKASSHFEYVLSQSPEHIDSFINLAAIKNKQNQPEAALILLKKANQINPNHEICQFMLNALSNEQKNVNTCFSYIEHLFNHYALYYDQHMMTVLHNHLPSHLETILKKYYSTHKATKAIDLGCGTGLYGSILSSYSEYIVGVDLSEKMLAAAAKKGHYHELHLAELLCFLEKNQKDTYDLIICMDVFSYIHELEPYIERIRSRLSPHGFFIFSTEISTEVPWKLQKTARFAHHPSYILSLLKTAGLHVQEAIEVIAREERPPIKQNIMITTVEPISRSIKRQDFYAAK